MAHNSNISAEEALEKLKNGNALYVTSSVNPGNISPAIRQDTAANGQSPYAIIVACSDSRVIPESIFGAGIGELFVIRVAGNVLDSHQLGSIEYAADHLGTNLVLILGHTHCGAVDAAIHHSPDGHIRFITDEIEKAIGSETDPIKASRKNVEYCVSVLKKDTELQPLFERGLAVAGGIYDIESGKVEFF